MCSVGLPVVSSRNTKARVLVSVVSKILSSRMVSVGVLLVEIGCHGSGVQGFGQISNNESDLVSVYIVFVKYEWVAMICKVRGCFHSEAMSLW